MTLAAPCAALRRGVLILAGVLLAGCSMLPVGSNEKKAAAPANPARAQYRLEVQAPDELRPLLVDFLDLSRFQNAPDTEAIDTTELNRLAAAAPAQARALLETEGYFSAEVTIARSTDAAAVPVLRVQVQPGPRTRVDKVTLDATGPLKDAAANPDSESAQQIAALQRDWALQPGQPFRQSVWTAAKNTTLARLRAEGYPAATWERTGAQVDATKQTATLALAIESGPLFRLGKMRVEGLERYDESTVRQLSTLWEGQPYSEKALLDYQERLQKAGLFEGATVEIDPNVATADAAPVLVRVHELTLQQATVGVGISANTGPRVTLEHTHRRPFGLAWVATNKFEYGAALKSWQGQLLSHPLDDLYRNLIAGTAQRLSSGEEVQTSWSARIGRTQDTPRIERLYFAELVHARVDNPVGSTSSEAVSANYQWVYRDLDSILLPTNGYTLSLQGAAGLARSSDAENGPFARVYGRYTLYKPLGASWYGIARVEAGQVIARDAVGIPDTLLFRAGGDDSVRGYAYRTLGPTVDGVVTSGRMLFTGSAEIARPISPKLPAVWWAAFIDAGNSANRWSDLSPALGYGLGLRWRSPVGPLRVDLAYGQEVRRVRMHLSVGIAF